MTWFHVVMFGGAASVWIGLHLFYRSKRFNVPTLYLEQSSSGIVVRQYPIERMLGAKGRLIKIESVSKIQLAKNCLSLFQQSGAAYDMWVPRRFESDLLTHAKALFPNAEFVRV